ncbi:serine O-acetyltransferase [Pusillimonas noertemannii]|nr:DapH/DapD/GlmU-related protein [Pusillimonas noertemannii]NYT67179.1 serine acetyltransferase [Pusillimonas noertemannii]TFL12621.1 serine acetyltransferase [Pusillimonas noertemannii]
MRFWDLVYSDLVRKEALFQPSASPPHKRKGIYLKALSPRSLPVFLYRCAFYFRKTPLRFLSHLFSLANYLFFGLEIAMDCRIGPGLFLAHTQGTVIGAYEIGRNAVIYQGVTLGAKSLSFAFDSEHRPTIGNDVVIGAGAKILGGVTIHDNAQIGANAVVVTSVPQSAVVGGVPAKILKFLDDKA